MTELTPRRAEIKRHTAETKIEASLLLDGDGTSEISTCLPFLDHMLAQTTRHGHLKLQLSAQGDLHIDAHHTVEDCGIVFGEALLQALGNKAGIARFGYAYAPLDESLARVVVDFSGRSSLTYQVTLAQTVVGGMEADLLREFFQALSNNAKLTLHVDLLRGINAHHQAESVFKAFGLALRMAVMRIGNELPSTKGVL